jgi:hypothetical protein
MASLTLRPRYFVTAMRSIYGYRSLKINRMLEKALKTNQSVIANLSATDFKATVSVIRTAEVKVGLVWPRESDALLNTVCDQLVLTVSRSEWSALITSSGGTTSLSVEGPYGNVPVKMGLDNWESAMYALVREMLSRGSRTTQPK